MRRCCILYDVATTLLSGVWRLCGTIWRERETQREFLHLSFSIYDYDRIEAHFLTSPCQK